MPTKNPRINVSVDSTLYNAMKGLASKTGTSMSMLARDLIRDAMEMREDVALAAFAEKREKSFDRRKALSHSQTWK